jgi:hypothetical protein
MSTRPFAALALIALLSGCAPPSAVPAPSPTALSSTAPSSSGPSSSGPSSSAPRQALGDHSGAPDVRVVDELTFLTPSRNIVCALTTTSVRCDIGRRQWTAPPKPAGCALDWGNGLQIQGTGPAAFVCAGDSLLGATSETVGYGYAVRAGDFLCDSASGALRCDNSVTGRGFTLAVEHYTVF